LDAVQVGLRRPATLQHRGEDLQRRRRRQRRDVDQAPVVETGVRQALAGWPWLGVEPAPLPGSWKDCGSLPDLLPGAPRRRRPDASPGAQPAPLPDSWKDCGSLPDLLPRVPRRLRRVLPRRRVLRLRVLRRHLHVRQSRLLS
jgi:hypothetical protein